MEHPAWLDQQRGERRNIYQGSWSLWYFTTLLCWQDLGRPLQSLQSNFSHRCFHFSENSIGLGSLFLVMAILLRTVIKKKKIHQLVFLHIIIGLKFKSCIFKRMYKTSSPYYYTTEVVSASSNICYATKREAVRRAKANSFTDKQLSNTERVFLITEGNLKKFHI